MSHAVLHLLIPFVVGFGVPDDVSVLTARYDEAEQKLRAGDQSPDVWIEILDSLYRLDRPAQALGAAGVAAKDHARHPLLVGRIARAYYRGGKLEQAAKLLSELGEAPKDPVAALVLAKLLHSEGKVESALKATNVGLAQAPDDAELLYQGALLHGRLGNNPAALRYYLAAEDTADGLIGYPKQQLLAWSAGRARLYKAAGSRNLNEVEKDGDVPFRSPSQLVLPTIDVRLNGQEPVTMLVDMSGGTLLSIDTTVAQAVGIEALDKAKLQDIVGQTTESRWAIVDRLQAGSCIVRNVATQIYPFSEPDLPGVKGVVGAGIFSDRRVTMDFVGLRFVVGASRVEQPGQPRGSTHLVVGARYLSGDRAMIPVLVDEHVLSGVFEMGSPLSCFADESLRRIMPASEIRESRVGVYDAKVAGAVSFQIGKQTFRRKQAVALPFIGSDTSRLLGVQIDMVLGWDIFKEMSTFAIDVPANQIVIEWKSHRSNQRRSPR